MIPSSLYVRLGIREPYRTADAVLLLLSSADLLVVTVAAELGRIAKGFRFR